MSNIEYIKTFPGSDEFHLFEILPEVLYPKESHRFKAGHNPVLDHLEGCYVLTKNGTPLGRFSLYENSHLSYANQRTACIGSYECVEDAWMAKKLIHFAASTAKAKGYSWLVGPMEGSTWQSYRFSLHNDFPNFLLEPYHHIYYNEHFKKSGFSVIARYYSNLDNRLEYDVEKLHYFQNHYSQKGALVRHIDTSNLEQELENIARFSLNAFYNNFMYTPIAVQEFVGQYLKLKRHINPKWVHIVEDTGQNIHAVAFAIPDDSTNTLIIKSIACRPGSSFKGIATYLAIRLIESARSFGFERIIHAFMKEGNSSLSTSKKYTIAPYKAYALYGLKL